MTVFADTGSEPIVLQSSTMENQNQAGGVVYTKTSTAKSDGTVDITLTAHTTGEVRQTSKVTPTDIVLVLDVSGSMDDNYTTSVINGYNAANGSQYTYYTWNWLVPTAHTGYGFNNNRNNLYINTGTVQDPVYTEVTYNGRDANGFDIFEYVTGTTEVMVYPALSGTVGAAREHDYSVVQLYRAQITSTTANKMESLQDAVKAFIDTTAQMNEGLADSDMHTISIVKFAGDRYANNTSGTLTLAEGNGRYTESGNSYNYSQVVKGLLPVNAANAATLKTAVDSLVPGGATSVDYGLRLAEAILMNRSIVVAEGAVDRNEVVVVFTDGDPNHGNGFDTSVANTCISIASNMESAANVKVYGVCIADNADATDINTDINQFMHYMTSNYPNATSMTDAGTGGSMENGYYMTPDNSTSLSMIFESII
ncbi:MAG: VWA domain-containing protein [Clostridiales bacterium]|nr:VWA domain-containing protein [Clostridiales bacterium]